MLRLKPFSMSEADIILPRSKDETAFYKWSAGILGEYPITKEKFNFVNNLMAFIAIEDDETVGFDDVILDKTEIYYVLGEEWKCKELMIEVQ